MQQALNFRTDLTEAGGCAFTAEVEADYGERVYRFTLACSYDGTDGKLTVIAPQEIADISAAVDGKTSEISFDGIMLEYGKLANGYVAPLSVPWLLPSAWQGDYIAFAGEDSGLTAVTYLKGYNEEELTVETFFEDNVPQLAEVYHGGKLALSVKIKEFSLGAP